MNRLHLSLPSTDIAKTVDYYKVLFEVDPVKVKPDFAKFLSDPYHLNLTFNLVKKIHTHPPHLGIQFKDHAHMLETIERLQRAGLSPSEIDNQICCYARQDKIKIMDPDGTEWELYVLLEDTVARADADHGCCGPRQCENQIQENHCCDPK